MNPAVHIRCTGLGVEPWARAISERGDGGESAGCTAEANDAGTRSHDRGTAWISGACIVCCRSIAGHPAGRSCEFPGRRNVPMPQHGGSYLPLGRVRHLRPAARRPWWTVSRMSPGVEACLFFATRNHPRPRPAYRRCPQSRGRIFAHVLNCIRGRLPSPGISNARETHSWEGGSFGSVRAIMAQIMPSAYYVSAF